MGLRESKLTGKTAKDGQGSPQQNPYRRYRIRDTRSLCASSSDLQLSRKNSLNRLCRSYSVHEHPPSSGLNRLYSTSSSALDSGYLTSSRSKAVWPVPLLVVYFLPEFPLASKKSTGLLNVAKIHDGCFSKVSCVKYTSDDTLYALKEIKKSDVLFNNAVNQCKAEILIQSYLGDHPFILSILSVWQDKGSLFILSPFMEAGDLYELWRNNRAIKKPAARGLIAEVGLAIDFLWDHQILHRDVKMENVLLDYNGHIKLTDFGLAKQLSNSYRTHTICGTLKYMAPEVLSGLGYSFQADWWSLGVMSYVLLKNKYPFQRAADHVEMLRNVRTNPTWTLDKCDVFLSKLLHPSPSHRLSSIEKLQSLTYFADINFDELLLAKTGPMIDYVRRQ